MTERASVLRSGPGLLGAADALRKIADHQSDQPTLAAWEATNLHTLATALVTAAALRTETRGSHWREDYPAPSDTWLGHLLVSLDARGTVDSGSAMGKPFGEAARTDTQSQPLHNASAGTGVHPDLTDSDGLTVRFVASLAPVGIQQSSPTRRASGGDGPLQADGAAEAQRDCGERGDG